MKISKRLFEKFFKKETQEHQHSGSGNGLNEETNYNPRHNHQYDKSKIKLLRNPTDDIIGKGLHRSGWPNIVKELFKLNSEDGILFDDFVEQNFCYSKPKVYTEDWVGVFHHPPHPPVFSNEKERMDVYLNLPEFKESAKHLKLAITLSDYHRDELAKYLDCPVVSIPHMIEGDFDKWSLSNWNKNHDKKIIQLGVYLRNTQLINQIPSISGVKKVRLWTGMEWTQEYDSKVTEYWKSNKLRNFYNKAEDLSYVPASKFDELLTENVIVAEMFDASASNGVLDCIVRNTPIIINRHPAVEEYLGKNYPLYFSHPNEIPGLLSKVGQAHEHLTKLDKSKFSSQFFLSQVVKFCETKI